MQTADTVAHQERVKILVNVPVNLKDALKQRAERNGQSMSWIVNQAVREYLEREVRK